MAAVVAASLSTEVDHGNSQQFGSYVNSLGLRALREAHSQVLADRKLVQDAGDEVAADLTELMESTFSLVCLLLDLDLDSLLDDLDVGAPQSNLATEMDSNGVTCSQFGCDEANENLIMECASTAEICESHDGVKYCIENATVSTTIEFDFDAPADLLSKQCWCPTSPPEMEAMGCSCFSVDLLMDYGAMMSTVGDHMMGTITEEEQVAAMNANNYVQIQECAFVADGADGTPDTTDDMICECSICNGGLGFNVTCNNLVTDGCTNFDTTGTDITNMSGGQTENPNVSILRMVEIPDADNVNTVVDDIPRPGNGNTDNAGGKDPASPNDLNVEPGNADDKGSDGVGVGNQDSETPVDVEDSENMDGAEDNDTTGTSDVGDAESGDTDLGADVGVGTKAADSPAASNSVKVTAVLISFFASAIAAM